MLIYAGLPTVLLSLGSSVVFGSSAANAAYFPTVDLGYAIYQAKLADVRSLRMYLIWSEKTYKSVIICRPPETHRPITTLAISAMQLLQSDISDLRRRLTP